MHGRLDTEKMAAMAEFRFELRRFLHFSETAAEEQGISAQQYQLLQVVEAVPVESRASISAIADRMILRHNSAVELVDRAERLQLVERVVDEQDHRRSLVVLTERGRKTLSLLAAAHLAELTTAGRNMVESLSRLFPGDATLRRGDKRWR